MTVPHDPNPLWFEQGAVTTENLLHYERPKYARGEHYYLSTACFHGVHEYCRSAVNAEGGDKQPATCKFCPAMCICPCHHGEPVPTLPLLSTEGE